MNFMKNKDLYTLLDLLEQHTTRIKKIVAVEIDKEDKKVHNKTDDTRYYSKIRA